MNEKKKMVLLTRRYNYNAGSSAAVKPERR